MHRTVRRLLLGAPIATASSEEEKVGAIGGLTIFAADAMSSVAYGPEEVVLVLAAAGSAGLHYALPLCIALAALIWIVATSYRQTVVEYPSGGGAYVVARENLSPLSSHIAGGALLTDYVLTVSVSVSAGIAAITSAWPALYDYRVAIAVACVVLIALVNLRGVRESAVAFALPVYGFVACAFLVIIVGLYRMWTGNLPPGEPAPPAPGLAPLQGVGLFLVLRAFASGCASLTGLEAVANGVQAFREPRGQRAATVMLLLALILSTTVVGVGLLIRGLHIAPIPEITVLSQIGERVFGRGFLYFLLQIETMLILVFAANTSFAGFPRLSAFMARDGFMPRQLANLGDRLVYQNGILVLGGLASVLIIIFEGQVSSLIPLYAVGVFTAFTLSQTGMVVHWFRKQGPQWRYKVAVNGVGALVTGIVLIVIAVTKFIYGAWIVCLLIPVLVLAFRAIGRHYQHVAARLSLENAREAGPVKNLILLLVGGMHRGTLQSLQFARTLDAQVRAVHVETGGEEVPRIKRMWKDWEKEIPLEILPAPFRNMTEPLLDYIKRVKAEEGYDVVTVILPEFVVDNWWQSLLHNHSALWLQFLLSRIPGVAVLNMRYKL
ncbi:MAG TPA: APC family permease [Armatimonadota bacterium]|jgi:amino acid transporter